MKLLFHEPAHLQNLRAHFLQVLVEAAGDVVRKIGGFHVVYLEAKRRVGARAYFVYIRLLRDVNSCSDL